MNQINCLLPGGYIDENGTINKHVVFTPLNGRAEALVAETRPGPALVTKVLSHSVLEIGAHTPSEELLRSLLVADRQYLLLKLREATFGSRIQAVLYCPQLSCGNKMDIDFMVDDIPIEVPADVKPGYAVQVATEDGQYEVRFRLPNGSDQEALAQLLAENRDKEAAAALLQRCIGQIGSNGSGSSDRIEQLSPRAIAEIEEAMAAAAPRIELTMEGSCPECGQPFAIPFDLERFVMQELHTSQDQLYREVHYLAYYYHWSESEIMEMSRAKRRLYIDMLSGELEKMNYAV
jgi:hypothetical protein